MGIWTLSIWEGGALGTIRAPVDSRRDSKANQFSPLLRVIALHRTHFKRLCIPVLHPNNGRHLVEAIGQLIEFLYSVC